MNKLTSMTGAIAQYVPDGSSVAMGLALEPLIPFAAAHEIIRQERRNLTLIGPISDILFDQLIGAGCVEKIIAAWVGEKEIACENIATTVQLPGTASYGRLKLLPFWDPLRGDPRFEKIVSSLAPKE